MGDRKEESKKGGKEKQRGRGTVREDTKKNPLDHLMEQNRKRKRAKKRTTQ